MGTFDRALFDALVAVGVPADRAERVVELFERGVDERYGLHAQVLATRRDVAELEARLVREMAEGHTRLMREVAECNVRIADTNSDLARWVLAALTAQTALIVGAMKLL
jgi:hypothetical protein